jgi:Zn finger protein HypA/HybF involved in hydrogenase expression
MVCPKCQSENVTVSVVNEVTLKNQNRGCLWWACIGWWWIPTKWICFTGLALLVAIFKPKKQKAVNKTKTVCACQQCGHTWNA